MFIRLRLIVTCLILCNLTNLVFAQPRNKGLKVPNELFQLGSGSVSGKNYPKKSEKKFKANSVPLTEKGRVLETKLWSIELTKLGESFKDKDPNRDELLTTIIHAVEVACFYNLRTKLEEDYDSTSTECLDLLKDLNKWYSANPFTVCSQDGIDALSCREIYQDFPIKADEMPDLLPDENKLNYIKIAKIEDQIQELNAELRKSKVGDSVAKAIRNEEQVLYKQLIMASCSHDWYKYEVLPEKYKENDQLSTLEKLVNDRLPDTTTPATNKTDNKKGFVRYIQNSCLSAFQTVSKWDPTFSPAICAYWGESSPQCIDALRENRKQAEKNRIIKSKRVETLRNRNETPQGSRSEGLGEF
jgi:hypothetical protein